MKSPNGTLGVIRSGRCEGSARLPTGETCDCTAPCLSSLFLAGLLPRCGKAVTKRRVPLRGYCGPASRFPLRAAIRKYVSVNAFRTAALYEIALCFSRNSSSKLVFSRRARYSGPPFRFPLRAAIRKYESVNAFRTTALYKIALCFASNSSSMLVYATFKDAIV